MSALGAIALCSGNLPVSTFGAEGSPVEIRIGVDRPMVPNDGNEQRVIIKIDLEGAKTVGLSRTPVNLAVVLDRSGSMSGKKLEQAKQAAHMLIDQLDESDIFSLVMYDTEVEVLVPARKLGKGKRDIQRRISRIQTGGSTALYDGVNSGGRELREFLSEGRINRVMLLSDGIANVGPSSNREIATLGQQLAREDISVTTVGLGDDYNENLMTALSEASDANYYYVADVEQLPEVFRSELGELKSLVARNITIRIECPEGVRPIRFLGRPEKLDSRKETIEFKTLSSDQTRELFLECAIESEALGEISEIVQVDLEFGDVENPSATQRLKKTVVVGYTKDLKLAERTVDQGLVAEAAIYDNAVETEKAIALADQGNIAACRVQLESQEVNLTKAWAVAPASQKAEIREELNAVSEAKADLSDETLSKSQRKKLKTSAYQFRNSRK